VKEIFNQTHHKSLNRTKIGLKSATDLSGVAAGQFCLNRTKIGLKFLMSSSISAMTPGESLNRTKIGLKWKIHLPSH